MKNKNSFFASCNFSLTIVLFIAFLLGLAEVQAQRTFVAKFLKKDQIYNFDYGINRDSVFSLPTIDMLEYFNTISDIADFRFQIGELVIPLSLTKLKNSNSNKITLQTIDGNGRKRADIIITSEYVYGFFTTSQGRYTIDAASSNGKALPGYYILTHSILPKIKASTSETEYSGALCDDIQFEYGSQYDKTLVDHFSNFSDPEVRANELVQGSIAAAQERWSNITGISFPNVKLTQIWTVGSISPDNIYNSSHSQFRTNIMSDWNTNRPCVEMDGIIYITGHTFGYNGVTSKGSLKFCETPNETSSRVSLVSAQAGSFNSENIGWIIAHEVGHMLTLDEEENCGQSCSAVPLLMCSNGAHSYALSACMRTAFDTYFSGSRCDCVKKVRSTPECATGPRCYTKVTVMTNDNPNPIKGCASGSDVINFTAKVQGGCHPLKTIVRVRYPIGVMHVEGNPPFGDYFNHKETIVEGGITYEVLSALDINNELISETFGPQRTLDIHFTTRYDPTSAIESVPIGHFATVFLGQWPDPNAIEGTCAINPFYPITIQSGQTAIEGLPSDFGTYGFYKINGDIDCTFLLNFPPPPAGPTPKTFIEFPPNNTSGSITYKFSDIHLMMGTGNKIHMNADTKLMLTNSTLEGCTTMWKGIELEDAAGAEILNVNIKDAQCGLKIKGYTVVDVRKTNFENNNFGVFGTIPNGFVSPNIKLSGNTYQSNGTFKSTFSGQLPVPEGNKGYAGVYFDNVALLNIGAFTPPGGSTTESLFKNLHNGIVTNRVNLNVTQSLFKDIGMTTLTGFGYPYKTTGNGIFCTNGSLTQKGFGEGAISIASFDNCHTAVRANLSTVNVSHNRIIKVNYGIRASNTTMKAYLVERNRIVASEAGIFLHQYAKVPSGCKVSFNHVTMTGDNEGVGIRLGGNNLATHYGGNVSDNQVYVQDAVTGIELQLANQLNVHNNTVHLEDGSINYAGIQANGGSQNGVLCNHVDASGQTSNANVRAYQGLNAPTHEWSCNTMSGAPIGMEFAGACDASDIRGNTFAGVDIGLQIGLSPNTGDAYTGPQSHRGNIWDDATLTTGASYLGNFFQVDQSKFTVDHTILDANGDDLYRPDVISGPPGWFLNLASPTGTYTCNSLQQPGYPTNCQPITFTPLRSLDDARVIAGDGVKGDYFQDAMQWSTRRHLYRQILERGNTYGSDTSVLHLLNDTQYATLRTYGDMDHTLRGTYAVSSADSQQMNYAILQTRHLLQQIIPIDSLLNDTSWSYTQRRTLYAQKDTLLSQSHVFIHRYDSLYNELMLQRSSILTPMIAQYAALTPSVVYEQNEKTVADIFIRTFARDNHDLNPTQRQALLSIAAQCPIEGGESVFLAREMLEAIDSSVHFYNDATLCQNAQKLNNTHKVALVVGNFKVSPNPASGSLNLKYDLGTSIQGQFYLTNLLGQRCLVVDLQSGPQQDSIVISSLAEGFYSWHVVNDGKIAFQGSLIIQR